MVSSRTALGLGGVAVLAGGAFLLFRQPPQEEDAIPLGQVGSGNPIADFFGFDTGFQGSGDSTPTFAIPQQTAPEGFFSEGFTGEPLEGTSFTQETADFLAGQGFESQDIKATTGFFPTIEGFNNLVANLTSGGSKKVASDPDNLPTVIGFNNLVSNITGDAQVTEQERTGFFNFFTQQQDVKPDGSLDFVRRESDANARLNFALASALRTNGQYAQANQVERNARGQANFASNIQERINDRSKKDSRRRSTLSENTQNVLNTPASEVGVVSSRVRNELQRKRLASLTKQLARKENSKKTSE